MIGRLKVRKWDDNGTTRWSTDVVVEEQYFAESKEAAESRAAAGTLLAAAWLAVVMWENVEWALNISWWAASIAIGAFLFRKAAK